MADPRPMTEKQLQAIVIGICKLFGIRYYHPHDSRRSVPGYPDLTLLGRQLIFRELKTATGRLSDEQAEWIARLRQSGQDAAVWRPEDLHSGRIQKELEAIR